jgi:hypothetical protein
MPARSAVFADGRQRLELELDVATGIGEYGGPLAAFRQQVGEHAAGDRAGLVAADDDGVEALLERRHAHRALLAEPHAVTWSWLRSANTRGGSSTRSSSASVSPRFHGAAGRLGRAHDAAGERSLVRRAARALVEAGDLLLGEFTRASASRSRRSAAGPSSMSRKPS